MDRPPDIRVISVKNEAAGRVQETPIQCTVAYRCIAEAETVEGEGISLTGSGICFRGPTPLPVGQAAEVRIGAVRGLSPPLVAFIELTVCERDAAGDFRMAGTIKGIRSE